ncbi:hypothetical protein FFL34_01675 [Lentibacillus cibarius]|uniref:Uncharacterized protein n=2 Tax=Lentibacillus cibarius TaxID=2583219 RepID=A0A5S3QGE4_9BACI|nr:hypothetical protein FFL34_01675 [Lentibacillus cibarius]
MGISMKKILSSTAEQKGFILPYVLFFIAIAFIAITFNVNLYRDEVQITKNQTEQLKIETLLQMGRTRFKDEVASDTEIPNPVVYHFPVGNVKIRYAEPHEQKYHLYISIQTDTFATLSITNQLRILNE